MSATQALIFAVTLVACLGFVWALWDEPARQQAPEVKPGERWEFAGTVGPWPIKRFSPVTILYVCDGWVRYSMSDLFPDCRMPLLTFASMYRKVEQPRESA
jgi:hypothetical protein